ncbi:MAG: VCBS repeat-containing protein, partial [Eubacterium sp.]|nr:VCBS repeat-containing protein [Eubacterium sp.]
MKTRFLAIVMAAALAVSGFPAKGLTMEAKAAEGGYSSGNALKAIGINSDTAPDGFDASDTTKNPYGKKTITGTVSDEVFMAYSGQTGATIIGHDNPSVTGGKYEYFDNSNNPLGKYILAYDNNTAYDELFGNQKGRVYISEVAVSGADNRDKAKKALTDKGYTLIDFDLNDDAGGDYIYFGYTTTTIPSQAVSDILFVIRNGDPEYSFTYEGRKYFRADAFGSEEFVDSDGDLNHRSKKHNVGIYCYTTESNTSGNNKTLITDLKVNSSKGDDQATGLNEKHETCDADLNAGAGGAYIYLHLEKSNAWLADVEGKKLYGANTDSVRNATFNKTAGGNFDGNTEGKKSQFAMVNTDGYKITLSVNDAVNQKGGTAKTLATSNIIPAKLSSFANSASSDLRQMAATGNLSIVTGDFDGNGIDEIAVFNPNSATNGACVEIYALENDPSLCNIYDMNSWGIQRTIAVPANNFISLDAGDMNQDGIDDLVIGGEYEVNIYHGSKIETLSEKVNVDMTFGGTVSQKYLFDPSVEVFREKNGGKMATYLGILSRYVTNDGHEYGIGRGILGVLKYDSLKKNYGIVSVTGLNINELYRTASGKYLNAWMPLELHYVNHLLMSPYCDLSFRFDGSSLTKVSVIHPHNYSNLSTYTIPYDFQVADLNGTGTETVFYKILKLGTGTYHAPDSSGFYCGPANFMGAVSCSDSSSGSTGPRMPERLVFNEYNPVYAIVNSDDDTAYMNYTGRHYFDYSDPEVLAVLSSPPYFKDLLANDNLSGNYAESTTSYAQSKGTGDSINGSATISAGVWTKFEQEVSVLGFGNVAQTETEFSLTASFTTEYEKESEVTFNESFFTSSGSDSVVFYSVPTEIYEYDTTFIDKKTGEKKTFTKRMFFPKQPCVATIDLDKYNSIAENYSELPTIDEKILDHKLGFPETYPENSGSFKNSIEYKGNWNAVDFASIGGGSGQEQSIDMSRSEETAFSSGVEMSFSAGGGAGGLSVGYSIGSNIEAGYAMTSTSGYSYTASMQNMPKEAEDYGYGMSWKLFAHEGSYRNKNGNTVKFPVVDYLVTDVMAPPLCPEELQQDYFASTQDSIVLNWEYEDITKAEEFYIYRVTTVDGRESAILAGVIGATEGKKNDSDIYEYTFTDDGRNADGTKTTLKPGIEYQYYVEARRSFDNPPSLSMPSEKVSAYTRSKAEYPEISVKGVTDNKLTIFPDRSYEIQVNVDNKNNFEQVTYQWQKYDSMKGWSDIIDNKTNKLSIDDATVDMDGEYRCRVDALFYNEELDKLSAVTAFTDAINIIYKMRSVTATILKATSVGNKPEIEVAFKPTQQGCLVTPSGNVKFIIEKDSAEKVYYVPLKAGANHTASAKLSDYDDIQELENGNYKVTVFYSGDNVFGSYTSDVMNLVTGEEDVIYPVITNVNGKVTNTFAYGDDMRIDFYHYYKDASGNTLEEKLTDETHPEGFSMKLLVAPGTYRDQSITVKLAGIEKEQTFNFGYNVNKRRLEVGVSNTNLMYGEVENNLPAPILLGDSKIVNNGVKLTDLVSVQMFNSSNTQTVLFNNQTNTGTYFARLSTKNNDFVKNYDIALYPEEVKVGPKLYDVHVIAEKNEGRQCGTVSVNVDPQNFDGVTDRTFKYQSGTAVKLTANPKTGYVFDHWEYTISGKKHTSENKTITENIYAGVNDFKAFFREYSFKVTLDESMSNDGLVQIPDGFVSGESYRVGEVLNFVQKQGNGMSPDYWIKVVGNKSTYVQGATLSLRVPENDVTLYPVFKGRPCKVNVGDGVIAEYTYTDDQEEEVTARIKDGDTVPKNTVISLKVGNDFVHYKWFVNEEEIDRNKDTSFKITGDSSIELLPIEAPNKPASDMPVDTTVKKVQSAELPENWNWDDADKDKTLSLTEPVEAKAIYVGDDKDEYENTTVVIRVQQVKCVHTYQDVPNTAKTVSCTEDGRTADRKCTKCGAVDYGTVIKAKGHRIVDTPEVKVTCTTDGMTEGQKCSICGEYTVKPEIIKAQGHKIVIEAAKQPTCTEAGISVGMHCSVCKEVLQEQKEVPALGHDEVTVNEVPATCITAGHSAYKKCSRCDAVIEAGEVIPAIGHKWDEGTVTKEATEEETGLKVYTCTNCGETKEEVIPMIGSTDPVKEALSVESITGTPTEMKVGDKQALTVIFSRDLTVDDSFEWIVSDPSVVSVEDGVLKASGAGAADVSFKLNGTESK